MERLNDLLEDLLVAGMASRTPKVPADAPLGVPWQQVVQEVIQAFHDEKYFVAQIVAGRPETAVNDRLSLQNDLYCLETSLGRPPERPSGVADLISKPLPDVP